jgi:hypothetical protein
MALCGSSELCYTAKEKCDIERIVWCQSKDLQQENKVFIEMTIEELSVN